MNTARRTKSNALYILLFLQIFCSAGATAQTVNNNNNYNNRNRTEIYDPYKGKNGERLNAFGEPILDGKEQEKQDSVDAARGRTRDRTVYRNRYKDSIQVYKIISPTWDTTLVDTSLNISKLYKLNPLRKDEYGYMPFPTIAQGYTPMVLDLKPSLTPSYGISSRSMYYRNADEINYYDVRTPWSEAMYYTNVFSNMESHVLDFNFTANAGRLFNFSIGYRGKRTKEGLYNYTSNQHGQLVGTFSFHDKPYRYILRGHVTYQFLSANENGGLTAEGMEMFRSNDKEYSYRTTLPVNLSGSDAAVANRLGGTRFYVSQSYDLFNSSVKNPKGFRISLLNEIQYQHLTYRYYDPAFKDPDSNTGEKSINYYRSAVLPEAPRVDSSYFNTLDIAAGAGVNFPLVNIYAQGMIRYQSSTYAFQDSLAYGTGMDNREKISGNTVSVNLLGRWRPMRYFGADASFDYSLSGVFSDARILKLSAYAQLNPQNRLEGSYMNASYYAPLVARYYRSSFAMFNWKNDFKRIEANEIAVTLKSDKIINAQVKFTDISNYVYFDSLRTPRQFDDKVNVLSVTVSRDTRIRWFGWDNTVTYQNVSSGASVMPLPEIMVRSSLYAYFSMFRKAVTFMPALTLKYYSSFDAPMYNPLLSDYNLQSPSSVQQIGDYPYLDISLSAKIRRTRLFIKFENFTPWVTPSNKNYFSAPMYPYLDPTLRFGVVWDWFN